LLRRIVIDRKPDGKPITIPVEVNDTNLEQQIKRFIEIADYNPFDGQLHISLFRHFHGGERTLRVLQMILEELRQPSIHLDISKDRSSLVAFFENQLDRHKSMKDSDFGYPGDRSRLPI
jgi:hypothetical protein